MCSPWENGCSVFLVCEINGDFIVAIVVAVVVVIVVIVVGIFSQFVQGLSLH